MSPAHLLKLSTCDERLIKLFTQVDEVWPCGIAVGYRDQADQNLAVAQGLSKDPWPTSKHNSGPPSLAVDAFPLPLDWNDEKRNIAFAGYVLGVAAATGVSLRWGGAWDLNNLHLLNPAGVLNDLDHFEIVNAP